jgi:hypothetical protein
MTRDVVALFALLLMALASSWSTQDGPPTIDARLRAMRALSADSPAAATAWLGRDLSHWLGGIRPEDRTLDKAA